MLPRQISAKAVHPALGLAIEQIVTSLESLEHRRLFSAQAGEATLSYQLDEAAGLDRLRPVLSADFNGDGRDDLLAIYEDAYTSPEDTPEARIYFALATPGNDGERFEAGATVAAWRPDGDHYLAGDVDGDGQAELVIATFNLGGSTGGGVHILDVSTSTPKVQATISLIGVGDEAAVQLGDFNGDGHLDLLASESSAHGEGLRLYANHGDGDFARATLHKNLGAVDPRSAAVADLDGDGRDALVWSTVEKAGKLTAATLSIDTDGYTGVLRLKDANATPVPAVEGRSVTADLNGDGREEVVILSNTDDKLTILSLDDSGRLQRTAWAKPAGITGKMTSIAAADHAEANGSVVAVTFGDQTALLVSNADGTASVAANIDFASSHHYHTAILADFNGDGRPELAASATETGPFGGYPIVRVQAAGEGLLAKFTVGGGTYTNGLVQFDADASRGDVKSLAWDFGDGKSDKGTFVEHRFAKAGRYTVTLTVTASDGTVAKASREVNVIAPTAPEPTARFSFEPSDTGETAMRFDASDSIGAGLTFAWTFADGRTAEGENVTRNFAEQGTQEVTLVVTDAFLRTSTITQKVTIGTVSEPPVKRPIAGEAKVGVQAKLTFDLAETLAQSQWPVQLADGLSYLIDWHDGTTSQGTIGGDSVTLLREFVEAGDQPYTLLIEDADGGQSVVNGRIEVEADPNRPPPQPQVSRGLLSVRGTGGDDVIVLHPANSTHVEVLVNGESRGVYHARSLDIWTGGGNDLVDLSRLGTTHYANAEIHGGWGDDTLIGGNGADQLYGMTGNDHIEGNAGDDELEGSLGNDTLVGGRGDDLLIGGRGVDTADYSANNLLMPVDITIGNDLADDADGTGGKDFVSASTENVIGGDGHDRIVGNRFTNYLNGRGGNDSLFGLGDGDELVAGPGDNLLDGGDGNDLIWGGGGGGGGGGGENRIFAGFGNDAALVGARDRIDGDAPERLLDSRLDELV